MSHLSIESEIRKSYFLNKYVIIAPNRSLRPVDQEQVLVKDKSLVCPLCPENIEKNKITDQIIRDKEWQVLSLQNKFAALSLSNEKAYGIQEVIIENRNHTLDTASLNHSQLKNILEMYAKRTAAISKNKKINYILCFKNQGARAGASLVHAHSQVFASEILPPDIQEEMDGCKKYYKEHLSCPYCDLIKREAIDSRNFWEDDFVLAFTPFASEFHYEAWLFTKRHVDNVTEINENEINSLCQALKIVLVKLKSLNLSFNLFLHQVVEDHNQHFYIKIQPRDSVWAGVELGSGLIINTISPEMAADYYRN